MGNNTLRSAQGQIGATRRVQRSAVSLLTLLSFACFVLRPVLHSSIRTNERMKSDIPPLPRAEAIPLFCIQWYGIGYEYSGGTNQRAARYCGRRRLVSETR